MTVSVVADEVLPLRSDDDVARVRRAVRAVAQRRSFDAFALVALTTAASEIARNAVHHGGGGTARIEELADGRGGIRLTIADEGPGIADLERVLRGGYSTSRSLGLGVSGTRRLVDDFLIESTPGRGTRVVIVKWTRR